MRSRHVGVILYGPPASGKDTITAALAVGDARYELFARLKVGSGRSTGYRLVTSTQLAAVRDRNDLLYENTRYGNIYAVDRPYLDDMFRHGKIPVVHMGQILGIVSLTSYDAVWITVLLSCSRSSCAERSAARGSYDVNARLLAWDETQLDLTVNAFRFDLEIDTDHIEPSGVAVLVDRLRRGQEAEVDA